MSKFDYYDIKQMGFKHTGLFPEQAVNWDFMIEKIKKENRKIKVLNISVRSEDCSPHTRHCPDQTI